MNSRDFYDRIAREFRAQDAFWDNPYDREIWRLEHDLLRPYVRPGGTILDLGCGFYPHFEFTRAHRVVAGDLSFSSLLVAREFGDESGAVELCQFDASVLPFRDSCANAVIAGGELTNHLDGYDPFLDECRRVLEPGGVLLLQVGAKWCFDSLYAITDALLGGVLGYAMTRQQVVNFLRNPRDDVEVTWDITDSGSLEVRLLAIGRLKRALRERAFGIERLYGANSVSGLIPLPIQQEVERDVVRWATNLLIRFDRLFGRFPPMRTFAGNVFLIAKVKE